MKFLLFDIDGTLIDSGGAGSRALTTAFEEMFSVADAFAEIPMAGKTDPQILREGLLRHGIDSSNGVVPGFFDLYIRHLKANLWSGSGHLKPGVFDALKALAGRRDFVLGLLTGNIEAGARIKLAHFGIASYFSVGAFGSDAEDRNALLPVAVERLRRDQALSLGFTDCVVIGDTPRDVECARPYGAYALAVATGPYTHQELAAAGADRVFDDLSDTGLLLSVLAAGPATR
jgi:phosphoglycolate phosphatase-like HAD superfamily hydrolase